MKSFITSVFSFLLTAAAIAQMPKASSGTIKRHENFKSEFVTARNVDVWLPEGYSDKRKYAVLYMHDGQMLFDSTITWNKQEWQTDEVLANLMIENRIQNVIVVGIWNGGITRHKDYFPQKPYENLSQTEKDTVTAQLQRAGRTTEVFKPVSDAYLKFLVTELKPFIDKNYSTFTNRKNTFIAGSSMGGLISMYAICEYPDIFGGAACMSTHWPGLFSLENNPVPDAFINYMKTHLPNPKKHKIYFDCGNRTLDAMYPPLQIKVDEVMEIKGYSIRNNWMTKFFPGDDHSERSWSRRLGTPLLFLLKK